MDNDTNKNNLKIKTNENSNPATQIKKNLLSGTYTLMDTKGTSQIVSINEEKITFVKNSKQIILINFFASWSSPCLHQISLLNTLQKKYETQLLLTGILVNDSKSKTSMASFLKKHSIAYPVSNSLQNNDFSNMVAKILHLSHDFPIPLTVMYVKGEYFTHYEGIVPIEMIEYNIKEAIKTLKGK